MTFLKLNIHLKTGISGLNQVANNTYIRDDRKVSSVTNEILGWEGVENRQLFCFFKV
jgi:hypothetical protein